MPFDQHANFGYGVVTVAPIPASSGTTFSMSEAQAAYFPDPASGEYNIVIWAFGAIPITTNAEIARVTAKASPSGGNVQFTITRTQEGSSARAIIVGDQVALAITKKTIKDIEDAATCTFASQETPVGLVNSSNTTYTTAAAFAPNTLDVFLNGVTMTRGVDYTENSTYTGFSMTTAPVTGDTLRVSYKSSTNAFIQGSLSVIDNEIPTGTINGTNTTFTLAYTPMAGTLHLVRDGQELYVTDDYTISGATITMLEAPLTGSKLVAHYKINFSVIGNAQYLNGLAAPSAASTAIVGTTDTQTLTNKTLTSPKINENVVLTATATELNVLDGITSTTAELNALAGKMGAWTAYTPTVTAQTGTITTYSASGRYRQIGKTVSFQGHVAITNNGTGATAIKITLPVAAQNSYAVVVGKEIAVTGKAVTGQLISNSPAIIYMTFSADNTYPGGTGSNDIYFSGSYEAA